jgi:hypothetical protein
MTWINHPVLLIPMNSLLPVLLTPVINIHSRISPQILEKFEMAPMEYFLSWGTLIHEKNFMSKIVCQAPFN